MEQVLEKPLLDIPHLRKDKQDAVPVNRIEFRAWPGNTEVMLIELIDGEEVIKDRFYTSANQFAIAGLIIRGLHQATDTKSLFAVLEDQLPEPKMEGEFANLHPYWEERRRVRLRRVHA